MVDYESYLTSACLALVGFRLDERRALRVGEHSGVLLVNRRPFFFNLLEACDAGVAAHFRVEAMRVVGPRALIRCLRVQLVLVVGE